MTEQEEFTVGVEEEFLLVDAESRRLRPWADEVLPRAERSLDEGEQVDQEFKLSQVETGTPACHTLEQLSDELTQMRRKVMAAAERVGARIAAAGTHPFSHWQEEGSEVSPEESYLGLERDYQRLAREKIICGCHVHVGISDAEAAIQVLNRVRPWLPAILALSVNSPFWLGEDTGYGSYRTEIWRRWPTAGTPDPFDSRAQFDRLVEVLLRTESIDDPARIHWDVRPSPRFPTLEFRVTDVCLTVEDAVTVAALARALVRTCNAKALEDEAPAFPAWSSCGWRHGGRLASGWTRTWSTSWPSGPYLLPSCSTRSSTSSALASTTTASGTSSLAWSSASSIRARARPASGEPSNGPVSWKTSSTSWSTPRRPRLTADDGAEKRAFTEEEAAS